MLRQRTIQTVELIRHFVNGDAVAVNFMPYKSKAQAAYFNANKEKLERQGVDVDEWNKASKGKKLPKKKKTKLAELNTSIPGETPVQLAQRLISGNINKDKFFQNAESHAWKGLPVPSFIIKKVLSSAKQNPEPYLKSLQKVPTNKIVDIISKNPEVFKTVKNTSFLPKTKLAGAGMYIGAGLGAAGGAFGGHELGKKLLGYDSIYLPYRLGILGALLGGGLGNMVDTARESSNQEKENRRKLNNISVKNYSDKDLTLLGLSKAEIKELRSKTAAKAPTLEEINKHFLPFKELLKENPVHYKDYKPSKKIVKDVPLTSKYKEVVRAAKEKKIGLIKRHLVAVLSRPHVWSGTNAFFLPDGQGGIVITPKVIGKDVLDHEYGHAEDYARLGGKQKWQEEYSPGFFERLNMTPREYFNRAILLPEARAWHYAGKPVDLSDENKIKNRAFGSYVNAVDQMTYGQ